VAAHVRAVRRFAPDLFHASLASPWSCQYGICAAAVARARTVAVYQLPVPPVNRRQRLLKRLTNPLVAAHVAVGRRTAAEVERLAGLRPGSARVIHNGVPDLELPPAPARSGPAVLGAFGRLEPQKGFDVLLEAVARLPEARAVLVGDGSERGRLASLAARLGVEDRVRLAGWDPEPRRLLPALDVFVLPSRFEGFPLAILEAQLAGLPVVASDVGSIDEAVVPGETGILVPPDDAEALAEALRPLLADAGLRERLGARGRERVLARFTAGHMARRFEALYEELLG
jgi:glycosyltransferase involved in cell wall biosynthesis